MKAKKQPDKKIIYYRDPENDDFAGTKIKQRVVDKRFKYVHKNPIWKFFAFLIYYVFALPVIWTYSTFVARLSFKFADKKACKKCKKCFIYGNHTSALDAYLPGLICAPKRAKIIVSPDAVSLIGMKNLMQMFGAIPVPNKLSGMRKFRDAITYYNKKGYTIAIYPEAHIWPYYTGVREFKDTSFAYPAELDAPVIAFFTAYTLPRRKRKKVKRTVYVSSPMYIDKNLSKKEAQKDIRDRVFAFMKDCSEKYSTYSYVEYRKADEQLEYNEEKTAF